LIFLFMGEVIGKSAISNVEVYLGAEFETVLATNFAHLHSQTVMPMFSKLVGHCNCVREISVYACLYPCLSQPPL
jgi:hypothetical protein